MRKLILYLLVVDFVILPLISEEPSLALVSIDELCLRPPSGIPKWIEIRNNSKETVELSGWRLEDVDGVFFKFERGVSIKSGEVILLLFYRGGESNAQFEASLPKGIIKYTTYNSSPFDNLGVYEPDEKYLETMAIVYEKLGKESEPYLKGLLKDKYDDCKKQAEALLKNRNYPPKYLFPLIYNIYTNLPEVDEVALLDINNKLISYVNWQSRNIRSEKNFRYEKLAIECGIWREGSRYFRSGGGISSGYEEYSHITLDRLSKDSFYVSENGTPGFSTINLPFQELELLYDSNNTPNKDDVMLVLSYRPPIVKHRWGYDFELASDPDFKNVLFRKNEPPGFSAPVRGRIYFKFSRTDYENLILWNPELFYRARRVFPDGYKTEWAGGECGEFLRKRYTNAKRYKEFLEMEKYYQEEVKPRLAEKEKIEKEISELEKVLLKEKRKDKISEMQAKLDEMRKKLELLTRDYEKHSDEFWRMSREMKRKYNPPDSKTN